MVIRQEPNPQVTALPARQECRGVRGRRRAGSHAMPLASIPASRTPSRGGMSRSQPRSQTLCKEMLKATEIRRGRGAAHQPRTRQQKGVKGCPVPPAASPLPWHPQPSLGTASRCRHGGIRVLFLGLLWFCGGFFLWNPLFPLFAGCCERTAGRLPPA